MCTCFHFCFFKQKTAYEMRISDWSSDVCSSDLRGDVEHLVPLVRNLLSHQIVLGENMFAAMHRRNRRNDDLVIRILRQRKQCGGHEIGRASGRERVCQYV